MVKAVLAEAERLPCLYAPDQFDTELFSLPQITAAVANTEDSEAWRPSYSSLNRFYAAHEARHPDIRLYGRLQRSIAGIDIFNDPGGTMNERLRRMRAETETSSDL